VSKSTTEKLRISIVTPSYNQGKFLSGTIESVISQGVDLQYVIIDGNSTDKSVDIIKSYSHRLDYWCSEPDGGQYAAINKGFSETDGQIMGWLNSSDLYFPWTLATVEKIFLRFPEIQWLTSLRKVCLGPDGVFDGLQTMRGFGARAFFEGRHGGPKNPDFLQQEATFWRRELWEKVGGMIPGRCRFAGDFHLWGEFFQFAPVTGLDLPLAGFRRHESARSCDNGYQREVEELLHEWQEACLPVRMPRGYQKVTRHWVRQDHVGGAEGEWRLEKITGDELLHLSPNFENRVVAVAQKLYCSGCFVRSKILDVFYFVVRLVLWPVRRRAPWNYQ
jgi:hypothetical protein